MYPNLFRERTAAVGLVILFIFISAWILHYPHDFSAGYFTVPDEKTFYNWALLYNDGKYYVPIQDWYGMIPPEEIDFSINKEGVYYIYVTVESINSYNGFEDIQVYVYDCNHKPVENATVKFEIEKGRCEVILTDTDGFAIFKNVPKGFHRIDVHYFSHTNNIKIHKSTAYISDKRNTYSTTADIIDTQPVVSGEIYDIKVRAYDVFNSSISDASVLLADLNTHIKPQFVGLTDENGIFTITNIGIGNYKIVIFKEPEGERTPCNVIIKIDDKYYIANEKAPGYSILLGWFIIIGIERYITIFLSALAAVATYFLARRLFGWHVAVIATAFIITCAVAVILVFTSGMADYATMTFTVLGMWLFVEGFASKNKFTGYMLFILSGLMLAIAVSMSYSTVTVIAAPFALLAMVMYVESRVEKRKSSFLPTKNAFVKASKRFLPFIIGLAIIGCLIANYNTTLFGSPFNAGYSWSNTLVISDDGNNNTTATIYERNFYGNFNIEAALNTIPNKLYLFLLVMPAVYIMVHSIWRGRRYSSVLFLAIWAMANILLYLFVPWVASWTVFEGGYTRSMEDMRYFLPALPAVVILTAYSIDSVFLRFEERKYNYTNRRSNAYTQKIKKIKMQLGLCIIVILIFSNIAIGDYGINMQLNRLKKEVGVGEKYVQVVLSDLFAEQAAWEGKLVLIETAVVTDRIDDHTFFITDESTDKKMPVHILPGANTPLVKEDYILTIKGIYVWRDLNRNSIKEPIEWLIAIRPDTNDEIIIIERSTFYCQIIQTKQLQQQPPPPLPQMQRASEPPPPIIAVVGIVIALTIYYGTVIATAVKRFIARTKSV